MNNAAVFICLPQFVDSLLISLNLLTKLSDIAVGISYHLLHRLTHCAVIFVLLQLARNIFHFVKAAVVLLPERYAGRVDAHWRLGLWSGLMREQEVGEEQLLFRGTPHLLFIHLVASEDGQQLQVFLEFLFAAEIDRVNRGSRLEVLVAERVHGQVNKVRLLELELHRVHLD